MTAADKKLILDQRSRDKDTKTLINITLIAMLVLGILVASGIWYMRREVRRQISESNQVLCVLFIGIDDNYRSMPPKSLSLQQSKFAATVRSVRDALQCPDTPQPPIVSPAPSRSG